MEMYHGSILNTYKTSHSQKQILELFFFASA